MKRPLPPVRIALPGLRRLASRAVLLALSACSGVIDNSEQPVTVFTEPPGAYCVLSRSGATVGVISTSPGLLHVEKSKSHISVRCSKALHEDGTAVLAASRRDLTIGQIVVKGPIGLAFDAGTGATHEYPSSITVFLAPLLFESAERRDRHYARQKTRVARDATAAIARIEKNCAEPLTRLCESKIDAVKAARDAGIDNLEAKRLRAKIGRG
ncbi:MAG: hypothetical protein OXH14_02595 [Alphaproteobacteria bacterium]|nr:hypothetical protein [Alphaproteobacteria bacterium]